MPEKNMFRKLKLPGSYWTLTAALLLCLLLIGALTDENTELWLDAARDMPAVVVEESSAAVPEPVPDGEEELDISAAEGILDACEPMDEPYAEAPPALSAAAEAAADADMEDETENAALETGLFRRKLLPPAQGEWSGGYGFAYNETYGDYRFHNGRDMPLGLGDIVCACEDGVVLQAEESELWGGVVALQGRELCIYYYGVIPSSLSVGDEVAAGEIIGTAAAAYAKEIAQGSHLHLVIVKDGETQDPADFF